MKSVSENFEKDIALTAKKNNIIINLKKNVKLFILCSFELSDFKDSNTATVFIEWFIKKKTSESSLKSSSDYSFSNVFINNVEIVHKLYICLFKIVSLTMILNNLQKKIENNYYLADKYNMKKEEIIYIFTQQNLLHM